MRRKYWVVVASALVIGVLAGCSDTTVAPSAAPSAEPTSMMRAPAERPSLALSGTSTTNGITTFTVGRSGGAFFVGNHAVVFPANSICDPAVSTYGPGEWDKPCRTIRQPITVTAQVKTVGGVKAIDFTPSLRFEPSRNPSQWVWIFMYTPEARGATDLSQFNILFAESFGATPVNDAALDPTLRTYVDAQTGMSFRRIKHFSGYIVASGRECAEDSAEGCGR